MFRLTVFIIAVLLLAGTVEPSRGWFIALTVVSGLSLVFHRGWWWPFGWWSPRRYDRFARRMARRFEREWAWDADW